MALTTALGSLSSSIFSSPAQAMGVQRSVSTTATNGRPSTRRFMETLQLRVRESGDRDSRCSEVGGPAGILSLLSIGTSMPTAPFVLSTVLNCALDFFPTWVYI